MLSNMTLLDVAIEFGDTWLSIFHEASMLMEADVQQNIQWADVQQIFLHDEKRKLHVGLALVAIAVLSLFVTM